MQPIRRLMDAISRLATPQACLFTSDDLRALLPEQSDAAFKTLLSRAVTQHHLVRVCRGLYLFAAAKPDWGHLLAHAVGKLRPFCLNYLSLESVLSDAGLISQMPINRLMVMSSGRSSVIDCGDLGSIEFVRTLQRPQDLVDQLQYDPQLRLWRATVKQALRDLRVTHRSQDLVEGEWAHESV